LGLGGATISVLKNIYTESCTKVRTGQGQTDDIPCERGVKQGCPLSPILFDLALKQLVRAVVWLSYTMYERKFLTAER